MAEFVHEGIRYRELPDGNVEVLGPVAAPPAARGQVFSLPPNPKDVAALQDQAADNARADRSESRAWQAEQRAQTTAERQAQTAELDAQLKRLQIMEQQAKVGVGGVGKEDRDRLSRLNQLVRQVNRVQELYDENIGATKGVMGVQDYLPTNENARFDAAGAALSQQGLAAFRVPGTGTVSDRDAMMFDRANLPTAATRDAAIEEQLLGLRSRVEEELRTLGQPVPQWGSQANQRADREDDPEALAAAGFTDPNDPPADNSPPGLPPANEPGATARTIASGSNRYEPLPRANAMVNSLMSAGASKATIDAALKQQGLPAISYRDYVAAKNWMKANPGKAYNAANLTREVPMSLMERAAGSTAGATAANYADAATAGISTAIAGERGRGALDAMGVVSPNASAVGSVLGGVTGAGLAELGALGALGRFGPRAAGWAPRVGDAAYGATQGLNSAEEGQGATGAGLGAVSGVAGGALGERAMRGLGSAFRGVRDPAVQALNAANVPMTVGQAVGNSGRVGGFVKNVEDAATSIPVVGGMINARRMEGLQGFNRAAFEVAGEPIGAQINNIGSQGLQQLGDARSQAYRTALDPVTIDANDPAFVGDLGAVLQAAQAIPNVNNAQDAALAALQTRIGGAVDPATDTITGRGFQEAYRGLARTGRERANSDYGYEVGQTMQQGQDALSGALERQNPGAFDQFRAANATNRRAMVLADALNRARNTFDDDGAEIFTPAQLNMADAGSTRRLSGPLASAAGDRPFYGLTQAGQSVLPSGIPDSGTASRMMTGLALSGVAGAGGAGGYALGGGEGAAAGTGAGLGAALALALGGTRGAQNVAVRMLLDRPDVAITVGEELRRRAALGGVGGAGILSQIVSGQ